MIKVAWDVEELVALIDVYRKSDGKTTEQIEKELIALSKSLTLRAQKLGIKHDEKFRNVNGMKMMFQNVAYVATNGQTGMSSASSSMRKVFGLPELKAVMGYAKKRWAHVGLFACSLGACFSLAAYADEPLEQALFLSPVLDMRRLIENMMGWFGVTQERLCRERAIETPTGETLYWDYYCYVKEHPVRRWDTPTSILCGGRDELCEPDVTARFARQYGCRLLTRPEAGHYFHTPKELEALRQWLTASL